MQKLWQTGIGWDESLCRPTDFETEWRKFFTELEQLNGVSLERCLKRLTEIAIFCDAFDAVAYTRWEEDDGTHSVRSIAGKSRVAH